MAVESFLIKSTTKADKEDLFLVIIAGLPTPAKSTRSNKLAKLARKYIIEALRWPIGVKILIVLISAVL